MFAHYHDWFQNMIQNMCLTGFWQLLINYSMESLDILDTIRL